MIASLLHESGEMQLKGFVVVAHLAQNSSQLLVLFVHACQLRLDGRQLVNIMRAQIQQNKVLDYIYMHNSNR